MKLLLKNSKKSNQDMAKIIYLFLILQKKKISFTLNKNGDFQKVDEISMKITIMRLFVNLQKKLISKKKDIICSPDSENFNEIYISYDNIQYQNIYYLAEYIGDGNFTIDKSKHEQFTEISNIDFFCLDSVINKFRDYDVEKKNLIKKINEYLINK